MAGGGSQPTQQNVTTTTSNLPEYARPYFENVVNRAMAQSYAGYQPYGFERIAGFTPAQEQVQQNILDMRAPQQFADASGLTAAAGQGALRAANFAPTQFSAQQIGMPELQQYRMQDPGMISTRAYNTPQMAAAQAQFQPNLQQFQMGPVRDVSAQQISAPQMQAAQTSFGQQPLEQFRMAGPQMFGSEQARQYMSPFLEQALEPQLRSAVSDARRAQITQDLGAARQGTFGGSRQLLASLEREGDLAKQMGDIRARGMQSAFENAQQQFERDRAAGLTTGQQNLEAALRQQQLGTQTGLQAALANLSNEQQARVNNQALDFQARGMNQEQSMRAALANQGVDVTRAQANLQANLGVQQLGAQLGMQGTLANLDAASQANVQNLAAQLQTQGMNADQALRAALANQQAQAATGQQNLQAALGTQQLGVSSGLEALRANQQAALEAQRMGEQSKQFGAQNQLAAFGQAGQLGQTLGNLGQYQQQADLQRLQAQQTAAGQAQALEQQYLDQFYGDFLRQRDYDIERLGYFNNILRGLPVGLSTTQTAYAPPPSMASQVLGTGLGALGMARTLGG